MQGSCTRGRQYSGAVTGNGMQQARAAGGQGSGSKGARSGGWRQRQARKGHVRLVMECEGDSCTSAAAAGEEVASVRGEGGKQKGGLAPGGHLCVLQDVLQRCQMRRRDEALNFLCCLA